MSASVYKEVVTDLAFIQRQFRQVSQQCKPEEKGRHFRIRLITLKRRVILYLADVFKSWRRIKLRSSPLATLLLKRGISASER